MSVAFRRDSDEEHLEPKFELPIPLGPNLVTTRGLAMIGSRIAELEARIAGIHAPYHARVAAELAVLRARWGAALLLDLHSMPPLGERFGASAAAEFVVGDRFGATSDGGLVAAAFACFAEAGARAAHNRP